MSPVPEEVFDAGWLRRSLEEAEAALGDLWAVDRSREYLDSLVEFREVDSSTQVFRLGTLEPFDHAISVRPPDDGLAAWRADVERHLAELRAEGRRLAGAECAAVLAELTPLLETRTEVFDLVVGAVVRVRDHLHLEAGGGLDRLDRALESWAGAGADSFAAGWQRPAGRVCAQQVALLGQLGECAGAAGSVVRLGQLTALGAVRAVARATRAQLHERAGGAGGDPATFLSAVAGAAGMLAAISFSVPPLAASLALVSSAAQSVSALTLGEGATTVRVEGTTSGALAGQLRTEVAGVAAAVRSGLDEAHRRASGHRHALGLLDSAGALVVPAPRLDPRVDPADFHHESAA